MLGRRSEQHVRCFLVCFVALALAYQVSLLWKYSSSEESFVPVLKFGRQARKPAFLPSVKDFLRSPSKLVYNLSTDHLYNREKNYYSWDFVDKYLRLLFGNQTEGFFVEAGALDGEFLSNSLRLERELNWTGLLIEPNPYSYRELIKKNRKSWSSNTCISKEYHQKSVLVTQYINNTKTMHPWVYIGSSHELSYPMSHGTQKLLENTTKTEITIDCFPLKDYLRALNQTEIDLLSLDLQGPEKDIIKAFPFDEFKVYVIVVESQAKSYIDYELKDFLTSKGYRFIACDNDRNHIFMLEKEFEHLKFPGQVTQCNMMAYI